MPKKKNQSCLFFLTTKLFKTPQNSLKLTNSLKEDVVENIEMFRFFVVQCREINPKIIEWLDLESTLKIF